MCNFFSMGLIHAVPINYEDEEMGYNDLQDEKLKNSKSRKISICDL